MVIDAMPAYVDRSSVAMRSIIYDKQIPVFRVEELQLATPC